MDTRIGFIGLGIMGRPMARNLMKAGYPLTVYNRSRGPVDTLAAEGAAAASAAEEVAAKSDVVITMVRDSSDVEEVILGPGGVAAAARQGLIVMDMSTISPAVTRSIAASLASKGVAMLDAPVSGGERGAIAASLSIMVGGPRSVFEDCLPVLEAMGQNIRYMGEAGAGQLTKLCNQILCGMHLLAMAESMSLAQRAGLDANVVLEVVRAGAGGSWMLDNLAGRALAGDFQPGFTVDLQQKDLRLALEAGAAAQQPLPGTAIASQMLGVLQAQGLGGEGTQAILKALLHMSQPTA